jgi:hypothetical protein
MRILFALLISCFLSTQLNAQVYNVGVGYYGIQSEYWPCDESFNALKKVDQIHLSFLYKTFGMNNECLMRFINEPRLKSLEIHLTNGAGIRKPVRRWYELLAPYSVQSLNKALENKDPATLKLFKRELVKVNKNILSYLRSDTACLVNPILEHNISDKAAANLVAALRPKLLPGCMMVINPMGNGSGNYNGADFYERHGEASYSCPSCITNLDGMDIGFDYRDGLSGNDIGEHRLMNFILQHRQDAINFLWIREFNGWATADYTASIEDPRSRKNFPNKILFDLVAKYILEAQNRFEFPPKKKADQAAFDGCDERLPIKSLSGFEWIKDVEIDGTMIIFPSKFIEQFEAVRVASKRKTIANFVFDKYIVGKDGALKQMWKYDAPLYTFPYYMVLHMVSPVIETILLEDGTSQDIVSSRELCVYINNPKIQHKIK